MDGISPNKRIKLEEGDRIIRSFPQKIQLLFKTLESTKQTLAKCQEDLEMSNSHRESGEQKIKILEKKLKQFENDENQPQ
jgi:hypothetical protein